MDARGLLSSTVYGNGLTVNYTYDDMDRVTGVSFGTTAMYSYSYDGEGNLQRLVDIARNVTTTFFYDLSGRLIRSCSSDGSEYRYDYDLNNNLTKRYQSAAGSNWITEYSYDADNRQTLVKLGSRTITDTYNATGTRATRVFGLQTQYTVATTYLAGANGSKTGMVATYQNGSDAAYVYEYDANGNITSITQGWSQATYTYDDMNQLVRVNDGFANLTTTYTYDLSGNILERNEYDFTTGALGTPTDTVAYTYNTTWRDQLASYDGQAITYDAIGNPLTYRGFTMTWQGKRLSTLSGNGTIASYAYNEQGIRASKTVNGAVTTYYNNGDMLMAQLTVSGTNQTKQCFAYESNGQLVSVTYNDIRYYYLRNGQNDIIGLMDNTGAIVVNYSYDAWGKLLFVSGTLATTLGQDNPFRYRGYYYDTETGLYYLQTRYYDPEVCRFTSADVYMSTGQGIVGSNMYAYCGNNPVMRVDPSGQEWWHWAIAAGIVALCAVAVVATAGTGGFALALVFASYGVAGTTAASTVAASALIGASVSLAGAAFLTAEESTSVSDFGANGNWGTVGSVALGAAISGLSGHSINQAEKQRAQQAAKTNSIPQEANDVYNYAKQNKGAAPSGYVGGSAYKNDGRNNGEVLPKNTTYREYDIRPFVGANLRGTERIVIGANWRAWYTSNHYKTFIRFK